MRTLRQILAFCLLYLLTLAGVSAQEDDKGFLTRSLQDALSGAGRTVSIDGFKGALSSAASFDQMTIADDDGIWLTLQNVVLEWNRAALLRGRLEVENLTAGALDLPRLPRSRASNLPQAEAAPFSLPDLPVSIELKTFSIDKISLGAPILGEAAQLSVSASAMLNDAEGKADLQARRTDGKFGEFIINAGFARSDGVLDLRLNLSEGDAGLASRLLNLPGQPSVDMAVQGRGPLDDFAADLTLSTDGAERLAGQVTLGTQAPKRASAKPDRLIRADIGGDITAILAPRYRAFFGTDVGLKVEALLEGNGAIELRDLALSAQSAELAGQVHLNADKWPSLIDISGRIANPDGTPILLPVSGDATTVQEAQLRINYDARDGEAVWAQFDLTDFASPGLSLARTQIGLDGTLRPGTGTVGQFNGDVDFASEGVAFTDQALAEAIGTNLRGSANLAFVENQPLNISDLQLAGGDYGLNGNAIVMGIASGLLTQLDAKLSANDLSRFSALAGRELDGQSELSLKGEIGLLSGQFDLKAQGSTTDLTLGIPQADAVLQGRTEVSVLAKRDETGTFLQDLALRNGALNLTGQAALRTDNSQLQADFELQDIARVLPQYNGPIKVSLLALQDKTGWEIDAQTNGPYGARLTAKGPVTGSQPALRFSADVPEAAEFVEGVSGPINAVGVLRQDPKGWSIQTSATGPYQSEVELRGMLTPAIDMTFDLALPDLRPLVPQAPGRLEAQGSVRQTDRGFHIDTIANGPFGLSAKVDGLATGPEMQLAFDLNLPNLAPLAPGFSGSLTAQGITRQTPLGLFLKANASGPFASTAVAEGVVTGPEAEMEFNLALPNIGRLVDKINGPLRIDGRARKMGTAWRLDTNAFGPSGTQAAVSGLIQDNGRLNMTLAGNAPLGLARPFLAPRDLQGQARFDLAIQGPPRLSSLSGRITTRGATFSAPNLRLALNNLAADVQIASSRARIQLDGSGTNGGAISAAGSVTLTPSAAADVQVGLNNLVLVDPRLYRTSINGGLRLAGPLAGGAAITGEINIGETIVNVPSTGLTSIGDIPPINHIGATRPVISTRRKAGIENETAQAASSSTRGYDLNLGINAPNRIFVRGRGLDAELGGGLTITGSTAKVISAGRFDLLRGRLDILSQRFDLREGSIQFQGDLVPFIRFVSATPTSTGEARVVVEGSADAPEVRFEATPEAPEDEVLAQLLFGRQISQISAFQALQLANAVATLAGRGGVGVISNLREGFGLDDLDVTTTDSGATAVTAGKYISDNIYTDVTASSDGTGEVSLNLDITSNLKGKATLGSDGNSGIGIFFEKDY